MTMPDPETVRGMRCLAELTAAEAASAAEHLTVRTLSPGELLFRQGDAGDSLYVLVSGEVEVRVSGPGGGEHHLARIGAGTFLGEFSVLADQPRTRTVVGCSETELWELRRDVFEAGLERQEPWATRFMSAVARGMARQMLGVDEMLVALMEEAAHRDEPVARVRDLEKLRRQLAGEWSF